VKFSGNGGNMKENKLETNSMKKIFEISSGIMKNLRRATNLKLVKRLEW
jgi:hypothetical protein